jgi:heptosyltransferase I
VVSAYAAAIQLQYKQSIEQLPWGTRAKGKDLMMQISIADVKKTIERVIHDNYPEMR